MIKIILPLFFILVSATMLVACGTDKTKLQHALELIKAGKSEEALPILNPLANKGVVEAQIALGYYFILEKKDTPQGIVWFRKAATSGNAKAQLYAGLVLTQMIGDKKYYKEGVNWLIKSANQNNYFAAMQLSSGYHRGAWGLTKDEKKSEYWEARATTQ